MAKTKQVWFRHDVGTLSDLRMQRIMRKFGMEGIGIYWCLVEMMYSEGGPLEFSEIEDIAYSLRVDAKTVLKMAEDKEIFEHDEATFWSNRILSELEERDQASEKYRQNALARWNAEERKNKKGSKPTPLSKVKENLNAMDEINDSLGVAKALENATVMQLHENDNATVMPPLCSENAQTDRQTDRQTDNKEEAPKRKSGLSSESPSFDAQKVFIRLPCIKSTKSIYNKKKDAYEYPITFTDVQQWQSVYTINVENELLKMNEWLKANPTKKKINVRAFIVNWLNTNQDRQPRKPPYPPTTATAVPTSVKRTNEQHGDRDTEEIINL